MKLLTDRTLEIPPFLLRNLDGGFAHPGLAVTFTAAVFAPAAADPLAEAIAASERQDRAIAQGLLLHTDTTVKERAAEQAADRKARKKAEQERLTANKLKQREVFRQHFKWDHEK